MKTAATKALALLLVLFLALPSLGAGIVLCIGEGGQFHLKSMHASEAEAEHEAESSHDCDSEDDAEDHCGTATGKCCYRCIDIPLPSELYGESGVSGKLAQVRFGSTPASSVSSTLLLTSSSRVRPDLATARLLSRSATTTVLRI